MLYHVVVPVPIPQRRTALNPSTISAVCLKVVPKWNEAPSQGKVIVLNLIIFHENNRLGPQYYKYAEKIQIRVSTGRIDTRTGTGHGTWISAQFRGGAVKGLVSQKFV